MARSESSGSIDNPAQEASEVASEIAARILGLSSADTESVRAVRREFSKRLTKASAGTVLEVARRLLDDESGDFRRFVAYEIIRHHRGALAGLREKRARATWARAEQLVDG